MNTTILNQQTPEQAYCALASLPTDLVSLLAENYLSHADASHLSQSSKFFSSKIQPMLNRHAALKLVQHVVLGEKAQVEQMLKANPELLLLSATVKDYSGRTIKNATAFEAALGAGDTDMAQMIAPYFAQLKSVDGASEHIKQYRKQLPHGAASATPKENYHFTRLVDVITQSTEPDIQAQLEHKTTETEIGKAITEFREYFQPGTVTLGHHFNSQDLINAFNTYDNQYDNWSDNKQDLFWRQVIGYIQRSLPTCDAQAFCQGIYDIVEDGEPLGRSLEFRYGGGCLFPVSADSNLGFDCGVPWRGAARARMPRVAFAGVARAVIETYVVRKHEALDNLTSPTSSKNLLSV